MDSERIVRLTVAGWALLLSWYGQKWILGEPSWPSFDDSNRALATIVAAFAASPILGFMISAVAHFGLWILRGNDPQFDVPLEPNARAIFVKGLTSIFPYDAGRIKEIANKEWVGVPTNWPQRWKRRRKDEKLRPYVDFGYHAKVPEQVLAYTTRRWTLYWMYLNTDSADSW
jgi:hypothetical protein